MVFKYKKLNYFQTKESSLNYKTVKAAGRSDRLYGHFASTSTTHTSSETIIKNNIFVGLYSYTIVFFGVLSGVERKTAWPETCGEQSFSDIFFKGCVVLTRLRNLGCLRRGIIPKPPQLKDNHPANTVK